MGEIVKTNQQSMVALLHGEDKLPDLAKPFERDIFLFESFVAGTTHIPGIMELEPHLKTDDKLAFFREPHNPYDNKAILIKNDRGVKIGYVPMNDNAIFSRLMDAGKLLFGKIKSKEIVEDWLKIKTDIY